MGVSGPGANPTEGTNIDDASARGAEPRESLARDEERAAGIGFKDRVPLLEGEALESGGAEDGGIVDEDVEMVKRGSDGSDRGANRGFGTDVACDGERAAAEGDDFSGGLSGLDLRRAIRDGYIGAGAGEGECNAAADAAGTAGDEGGFAGEWKSGSHMVSVVGWRG